MAESMPSYSPKGAGPSAPWSGGQPIGGATAVYMIGAGDLLCPATWMHLARGDHDCRELLKASAGEYGRKTRCVPGDFGLFSWCAVLCLSLMRSCWCLCGAEIQGRGYPAEGRKWTVDATKSTATLCSVHLRLELGTWALGCPYG